MKSIITQKQTPCSKGEFIKIKKVAEILGLAIKTIYNGGGKTKHLRRVRQGHAVRLLCDDVLDHRDGLIKEASRLQMEINQ